MVGDILRAEEYVSLPREEFLNRRPETKNKLFAKRNALKFNSSKANKPEFCIETKSGNLSRKGLQTMRNVSIHARTTHRAYWSTIAGPFHQ